MPTWSQMLAWGVPGLLALGALAWLAWALFADRSRGRARCPKCAYDMAGAGGLTCPECGRTVRTARGLYRTRRRWRQAACAVLLLAMAYPARVAIHAQQVGWPRALPSIVLVEVAPLDEAAWAPLPRFATPSHPLTVELCRRAAARELTVREWRRLFARLDRERPDLLALQNVRLVTRMTWSRDADVTAKLLPRSNVSDSSMSLFMASEDLRVGVSEDTALILRVDRMPPRELRWAAGVIGSDEPLGRPGPGATGSVIVDLCLRTPRDDPAAPASVILLHSWEVPFDVVDHAADLLTPSRALTTPITQVTPQLELTSDGRLKVRFTNAALLVAARVEVHRETVLVARGEMVMPYRDRVRSVALEWVEAPMPLDPEAARWRLALIGDAALALRTVNATMYWDDRVDFNIGPDGTGTLAAPPP